MKYKLFNILLCIILFCSVLFPYTYNSQHVSAEENDSEDLIVSAEELYLREGPGLSYPITITLKQGQALTFIEKQDDWYHVKTEDMEGWVASWLTETAKSSAGSTEEQKSSSVIISQVDHLNIRADASISASILGQLNSGDKAEIIEMSNGWIHITSNGTTGWVSTDYVTVSNNESSNESNRSEDSAADQQEEAVADSNLFTITVNAVNIRKNPDLTSKVLGTANLGEKFKVIERNNNWIKIQYGKKEGWIYSFYGTFKMNDTIPVTTGSTSTKETDSNFVTIIYNGTNLREQPSTSANIVVNSNAGQKYPIVSEEGEWFQIEIGNNQTAYVANWVVAVEDPSGAASYKPEQKEKTNLRKKGMLKGLSIVIDPGHGGNDAGTIGVRGTLEKDINLVTAELLKSKLSSAGAEVILTRESDDYVDLRKRVAISNQYSADAFISIHYDATNDSSISGFTTYYTNGNQQELAEFVHDGLAEKVSIRDRGIQTGNYLVTRENKQAAILLELGYLSNPSEENIITTDIYREQATLGIYNGLLNYFDSQLEN